MGNTTDGNGWVPFKEWLPSDSRRKWAQCTSVPLELLKGGVIGLKFRGHRGPSSPDTFYIALAPAVAQALAEDLQASIAKLEREVP